MARRYRKKPVVVEAVQWDGGNQGEVAALFGEAPGLDRWVVDYDLMVVRIKTLEGEMLASEGDWIIKGVAGECYPCKPDIFGKTYEEA